MNDSLYRLPQQIFVKLISVISILFLILLSFDESDYLLGIPMISLMILIFNYFENQHLQFKTLQQQIIHLQQKIEILTTQNTPQQIITDNTEQIKVQIIDSFNLTPPSLEKNTAISEKIVTLSTEPNNSASDISILDTLKKWFIGDNSLIRIASLILIIGFILLIRFSSEYWQFSLSTKLIGIACSGLGLTALGIYLKQKNFDYAMNLQGTGLGIVFLALFSAYHFLVISSIYWAYGYLSAILIFTLYLSLKQNSLLLAFIAFACAFFAPFILNQSNHAVDNLMAYYVVLNGAFAVIAWLRPWKILNSLALWMTFFIGGLSIWMYAKPAQYLNIAIWVGLLFILYLVITIRYSYLADLNLKSSVSELKQISFNPVSWIDSSLIFATPFMAVSLYASVAQTVGLSLSVVSAMLAIIYALLGYWIQRKSDLNILSQCFYGLALVFFALILPFAFNAYWTSMGWAIHGSVMLYFAWRYQLKPARYLAVILLVASGLATLMGHIWDGERVIFATLILASAYALAWYFLSMPPTNAIQPMTTPQRNGLLSSLFLGLSFIIIPYVFRESVTVLGLSWENPSLAWSIWSILILGLYYLKHRALSQFLIYSSLLLNVIIFYFAVIQFFFIKSWLNLNLSTQIESTTISLCSNIFLLTIIYAQKNKLINNILLSGLFIYMIFSSGLWITSIDDFYISSFVVILLFIAIYYINWLKSYLTANFILSSILFLFILYSNFFIGAKTNLYWVTLFNPVDISQLGVYMIWLFSLQDFLKHQQSIVKHITSIFILITSLFVISSILLRALQYYLDLPYWSWLAWQNNTIQMSFTLLWSTLALIFTIFASKKSWRELWLFGIAILILVIIKLMLLDLAQSQTITRIISFMVSGLMMLAMGYFAPIPNKKT